MNKFTILASLAIRSGDINADGSMGHLMYIKHH